MCYQNWALKPLEQECVRNVLPRLKSNESRRRMCYINWALRPLEQECVRNVLPKLDQQ